VSPPEDAGCPPGEKEVARQDDTTVLSRSARRGHDPVTIR